MKKVKVYRQGDVIILPINDESIKEGFTKENEIKPVGNRSLLALGEVTGHAHAMPKSAVKQYRVGSNEYVSVSKPAKLTHEEHAPIEIPAGTYQKIIAREYDQVAKLSRNVLD
jgi:hypothetical protein